MVVTDPRTQYKNKVAQEMNMEEILIDGLNKIAEEEPSVEKDEESDSMVDDDASSFNTSSLKKRGDSQKGRQISISENSISLTSSKP